MDKSIFKDYAELDKEIGLLETKRAELKAGWFEEMKKDKVDKVESDFGTFSVMTRKSWEYSNAVSEAQVVVSKLESSDVILEARKAVTDLIDKEQKDGTATATESQSPRFQGKKVA